MAVWDSPEGIEIVEGHGRVLAAKKLGLEKLPAIRLDHLTDGQRRAYTHVHNQLTMNTGWDFDKLEIDLEGLDFDFGDFGFDLDGGEAEEAAPAGDNGYEYEQQYAIEVICKDEADQEATYAALTGLGYSCKVVVV